MGKTALQIFSYQKSNAVLPFYYNHIPAGFPSPADDFIDVKLDLNEYLVKNPVATFFVRVSGDAMKNVGIFPGDILIVDRSVDPLNGSLIVAVVNGELMVRCYHRLQNTVQLTSANQHYHTITITEDMEFQVWGVVTYVIHKPK